MRRFARWALAGVTTACAIGAGIAVAGEDSGNDHVRADGAVAPSADSPGLWCFRPDRRAQEAAYETALIDAVDPAALRAFHDRLANEPHVAGSEGDLHVIEYLRDSFEKMGLEVEVQWIDVYLARPIVGEVEIVQRDGRTVSTSLPVKERPVDEYSADPRVDIGWNAYSGSGEVTGEIVYANYATKEDFEKLRDLGVDCTGKIVLARYGGNFRGYKAKFAQEAGAAGLIIYNDPEDVGYVKGLMYPEGGWANETQIQRGGIATLPQPGDPLTPGEPAIKGTTRLEPAEVSLPRIPVQPVGWAAAKPILEAMRGDVVPEGWQGGLDVNYRLEGGEGLRVRLKVEQERKLTRTANVVGTLRGTRDGTGGTGDRATSIPHALRQLEDAQRADPDNTALAHQIAQLRRMGEVITERRAGRYGSPFVVVGCHHDAWTHGAGDPTCGLIIVMEMARTFSELAAKGQRPDNTICFAAWGAEEYGIIGSTEWVEQHAEDLSANCLAYLNLDMAAMGPNFGASASPLLKSLIADATRNVEQIGQPGTSVCDAWTARADGRTPEQQIGSLGGGSDHVGFYCHLGIPSMGMGAGGSSGVSYHSAYDNLAWYRKVVGDDYEPAAMITRVADVAVARLANADVIPYDFAALADQFSADLDALEARASSLDKSVPPSDALRASIVRAQNCCTRLRPTIELVFAEKKDEKYMISTLNQKLMQLSRAWIGNGLPARPWYRNLCVATDPYTGYGSWELPELRWCLESNAATTAQYEHLLHDYSERADTWAEGIETARQNAMILIPAPVERP